MSTDTNKAQDAPRLTDAEAQRLCLELARADSEAEVITVLEDATVWDADELWVDYGKKRTTTAKLEINRVILRLRSEKNSRTRLTLGSCVPSSLMALIQKATRNTNPH
jgi:hypothetical protein